MRMESVPQRTGAPVSEALPELPEGEAGAVSYEAYRAELVRERLPGSLRSALRMAFVIQNLFLVLDYLMYPGLFAEFFGIRMALNAFYVLIYLASDRWTQPATIAGVYALGLAMLAMVYLTGATTTPYYVGLVLVFFAVGVMIPLTRRQAAVVSGSLALIFALGILHDPAPDPRSHLLHSFFMFAAALEMVFCCAFLENMRFRDFRQRQQLIAAQEYMRELDRAKSRFTANVHHELRTPLTLTLAPLEGMLAGDFGPVPEALTPTLRSMHANGLRLLKLINNLLDLAKIEGAQLEIRRRETELAPLVGRLVDGARPLAARKDVELGAEGFDGLPRVCVDPEALEKIVVNLVGNALKFTEAGGRIEVVGRGLSRSEWPSGSESGADGAGEGAGGVAIDVRDDGAGIPVDQLERIFDRFAQVDGSSTRRHEGTGIGLALVKELVELHGGRIWAESEGLGRGATMCVRLPLGEPDEDDEPLVVEDDAAEAAAKGRRLMAGIASEVGLEEAEAAAPEDLSDLEQHVARREAQASGTEEAAAPPAEHPPETPEVLIVEDNPDMRELLRFLVSREFRVRLARNGREGLEAALECPPDLVLTDVMMPEMSGIELCRALKQEPETASVPVALVTSKADREMKIEGLELGADDYVTKPFHPRELMARVRSLVRLYRLQDELGERNEELRESNDRLVVANEELERAMRELCEAEEQLVESERRAAVGELAAGVAHEVNNPVNFALNALRQLRTVAEELRTFAGKLSAGVGAPGGDAAQRMAELARLADELAIERIADDLGELLDIANNGLERTHRLVGDLRDFAAPSRASDGPVDLARGLRSTLQLLVPSFPDGLSVECEIPDDLPPVRGDRAALNQVILNLLKNAAEALPGGRGRIDVSVAAEAEGRVVVRIRDDGQGMSAETRDRLFEPFFTTKPAGKGTGLGLSMSRRIVHEHGGELEVESEPGAGTTVTLRLPGAAEPPASLSEPVDPAGVDVS